MSSTSSNAGLRAESLSFNTSYLLRTRPPPSASIVSTPTASFGPWALRRTIWPLAPPLMKLFLLADNHTVSTTPIHHQNHLRPRPLRPHLHPIRHLHLLVHAHPPHLHPILNAYFMIPPLLPLPHGQPLPAVLLPLLSLRHWIVLINILLMVVDFYMVTSGKQLDTGHLPHRLRLLLTRYFHHILLDLLFRLYGVFRRIFEPDSLAWKTMPVSPLFSFFLSFFLSFFVHALHDCPSHVAPPTPYNPCRRFFSTQFCTSLFSKTSSPLFWDHGSRTLYKQLSCPSTTSRKTRSSHLSPFPLPTQAIFGTSG